MPNIWITKKEHDAITNACKEIQSLVGGCDPLAEERLVTMWDGLLSIEEKLMKHTNPKDCIIHSVDKQGKCFKCGEIINKPKEG